MATSSGEHIASVYVIKRNNNVCYVGIATNVSRRWREHKARSKDGSNILYRAMRKYGVESFSIEEVLCELTWAYACSNEVLLINLFGTFCCGANASAYNMTKGGDGTIGRVVSIETKAKVRSALSGIPRTDDAIRKSVSNRIYASPTDDVRKKLSESNLGKRRTTEQCENIRAAAIGRRPISADARKKMSDSAKARCARRAAAVALELSQDGASC
jgi:group I intron endonuclease